MPSHSTTVNGKIYTHSPSPIYGIPQGFDISDLPAVGCSIPIPSLTNVSATTTSATLAISARSMELDVSFSTINASCQIDVYTSADGFVNSLFTQVATQVDINPTVNANRDPIVVAGTDADTGTPTAASTVIYVGNFENVDLNGYNVRIKVSAISAGTVSVAYKLKN